MNSSRTSAFLMANLGSEMSQLFSHAEQGEWKLAQLAADRAEKIINELLSHQSLKGRTEEVEILRRIIHDVFLKKRQLEIVKADIEEYFFPFALRATAS